MKNLVIIDEKEKKMYMVEKNIDSYNLKDLNAFMSLFRIIFNSINKIMDPEFIPIKPNTATDKDIDERLDDPGYVPKNAEVKTK